MPPSFHVESPVAGGVVKIGSFHRGKVSLVLLFSGTLFLKSEDVAEGGQRMVFQSACWCGKSGPGVCEIKKVSKPLQTSLVYISIKGVLCIVRYDSSMGSLSLSGATH